jgi:PPOX class probable F420-dependent enzyme
MSPPEWRSFLNVERTAVLASAGSQQSPYPHLVAMWYVPQANGLLMWTYAKSQKVRNLRRDPRVSALVEAGNRYDELRGVLIQADAEIIEDFDQVLELGTALHERYAEADSTESPDEIARSVRAQAAKRVVIRVPFSRVVSWDHRKLNARGR